MKTLISEVRKRPTLWKKTHKDHRNRVAIDREWSAVALTVGVAKELAKNKWKNLRDHFIKELKKIPSNCLNSQDPQEFLAGYKGRWFYFPSMLFLRDEWMIPYSPLSEENISDDGSHVAENSFDEAILENNSHSNSETDPNQFMAFESSLEDAHFLHKETNSESRCTTAMQMPLPLNPITSFPIKTEFDESSVLKLHNNDLVQVEGKTLLVLPGKKENDDEDFYFLKSLLPYLKQLSPIKKLQVRNQFQNILIQELTLLTND